MLRSVKKSKSKQMALNHRLYYARLTIKFRMNSFSISEIQTDIGELCVRETRGYVLATTPVISQLYLGAARLSRTPLRSQASGSVRYRLSIRRRRRRRQETWRERAATERRAA